MKPAKVSNNKAGKETVRVSNSMGPTISEKQQPSSKHPDTDHVLSLVKVMEQKQREAALANREWQRQLDVHAMIIDEETQAFAQQLGLGLKWDASSS